MTNDICSHCAHGFIESEDSYCRQCGHGCCEDCLDAQACPACVGENHRAFLDNERWQAMTDKQRCDAIRSAL